MKVWLIHIWELLPIDPGYRPFRYGLLSDTLIDRGHYVTRWAPTFVARRLNGDSVPTSRGPEWSARCSGLWRAVTIENILRNPAYVGDLAWNRRTLARFFRIADGGPSVRVDADIRRTTPNPEKDWIVVRNSHQPLIDRDTWLLAQAGLADRTTPRKAVSPDRC